MGAVVDMQAAVDGLCARPRLGRCRDCTAVGGLSGHEPRDSRDLGAQCQGPKRAADLVRWLGGGDDPGQFVRAMLFSRRPRIAGHSVVWALIVGTASEHSGR